MHYTSLDIGKICEKKINVKKPLHFDDSYTIFNVTYDDSFFLLNVSNVHLSESNSKFYSYVSNNFVTMYQLFDTIMNRVSNHSKYKHYFADKQNTNRTDQKIKIPTSRNEDIVVFDLNGQEIDIARLYFADRLNIVLYLKHIWINRMNYGFYFVISQILRNEPIGIKQNLFMNDSDQHTAKINISRTSRIPIPPPPPIPPTSRSRQINKPLPTNLMRPTQKELLDGICNLRKITT